MPTVIFNLVVSINNNLNSNNNNDNQNNLNAVSQSTNNLVTNTNAVNKISVTLLPSPGKRSVDQMIECQSLQGRRAAEEISALYLFQVQYTQCIASILTFTSKTQILESSYGVGLTPK